VTQTTEEHADLLGALALAIHEKAIAQAEYAIRPLVYGDNAHQQDYLLPQFLAIPELLAAVKLTPEAGNVLWTFRLPDGKQVSRSLHPVDREPIKWSFLPKSSSQSEKRHWFTKSSDGLIYARLTDIQNDPKESVEQFAESVFAELAATPNSTLILDLRDNQGGDNTLNDAIVRAAIRSPKVWEPGRFFVLINGGTFSAASNLVTLLERWIPVIFVGQPTGGAPNEYGDPKRVVLPESGLSLLVSSLYWQVSSPTDQRDSTTPLLPVEPTAAALRNGRDDSVNLIRALLKEPVATNGNFAGRWAVPNQQLDISLQLTTDTARLTVHPLQIDAQPIANLKRKGATLEGDIALGNQNIAVHGRLTGSYLLGWLELSGRPYSFVARAQSNP